MAAPLPAALPDALVVLDYFGIAVFAVSGALLAAEKRQTIVTFIFFAVVAGIGGGTLRDLLIGAPVFWVQDSAIAAVCIAIALIVWVTPERWWQGQLLEWADAVGLAAYAVFGTAKAIRLVQQANAGKPEAAQDRRIFGNNKLVGDFLKMMRERDHAFCWTVQRGEGFPEYGLLFGVFLAGEDLGDGKRGDISQDKENQKEFRQGKSSVCAEAGFHTAVIGHWPQNFRTGKAASAVFRSCGYRNHLTYPSHAFRRNQRWSSIVTVIPSQAPISTSLA